MKIVALIKQVPDTYGERKLSATGVIVRGAKESVIDEISERALEIALSHKDKDKSTQVVALSMGPESVTEALRKALSLGADSAVHVCDDQLVGADLVTTARVLAAALKKEGFDLIVTGNQSSDGQGGTLPAMLAEHLSLPAATALDSLEINGTTLRAQRSTDYASATVHTTLPAVVSVTERAPEARFPNFRGIMSAKRKPLSALSLDDLDIDLGSDRSGGRSVVLTSTQRPARTAGIKITDEGQAAAQLAEFLSAGRLI
ncbi:electron transfer flavoprotein subunit beta/FixA family protein [Homoserinimonas sp. OAct 916]|uniref:electron transfer flavoprotein subunit beta/FixA family protein n=1 Tax=Homoserinimonas sp. OAct 916 TaxID=2211450 RepID=UPI000DBE00C5|nr:electron transfer flavoprotein subunit beta/FixA family protein [Homoserinimonas sp. OAct 916]